MIMNRFQQYENSPTTVALLNGRFIKQQLEPLKHIYIMQIFRVNHSCFNSISVQQRFILAKSCKRQNDRTKQKWSFLGGLKKWIEKKSTRTCEEQKPLQWRDNHDLTIETLSWSAASRSDKSRLPSSSAPTESWSKPQPLPQLRQPLLLQSSYWPWKDANILLVLEPGGSWRSFNPYVWKPGSLWNGK